MSLIDYQKEVHKWVSQFDPPYWPIHEMMACLSEEAGEVAREINHLYGTKKKKDSEKKAELGNELVDVLFTIICLANGQKINLESAWRRMIEEKMGKRDKDRFDKKE
tara:strand:+ start:196 stop:516 length:321 start_codon:yes stop_codon:yes gene_type:complete